MASNLASSETEHQYSSPASPKDDFIQLFLKYPSAADKYVEDYLRDHEFGENVAQFNKLSRKTAVVTVKPASVGNTLVSNLNGAKIQGQYNLQAEYYKKKSVIMEKQSKGSTENATSMGNDCELYVGASLPSSTTKKDIYEHFDKFASDIQNVELAEDEFTHLFKGHVFIKFSTPEAASRAMQTLHHTWLLGICINIRPNTRKTSKVISKFSPPSHGAKLCHGTVRGEYIQSQSSLSTSTAVSQTGGSIKVTNLPQGITKEELRLHFLSVGVIKGSSETGILGLISGEYVELKMIALHYIGDSMDFIWKGYGFQLSCEEENLPSESITIKVSIIAPKELIMPKEFEAVSGLYFIDCSYEFKKPVTIRIQHCATGSSLEHLVFATSSDKSSPYRLHCIDGKFDSNFGELMVTSFSRFLILRKLFGFSRYEGISYSACLYRSDICEINSETFWNLNFFIVRQLDMYESEVESRAKKMQLRISGRCIVEFNETNEEIHFMPRCTSQNNFRICEITSRALSKRVIDRYNKGYPPSYELQLIKTDAGTQRIEIPFDIEGVKGSEKYIQFVWPNPKKLLPTQATTTPSEASGSTSQGSSETGLLDEDDQADVEEALENVQGRWRKIGTQLHVKTGRLNEFRTQNLEPSDAMSMVVFEYLKRNYNVEKFGAPTWMKIVDAVRKPAGGNNNAEANKIAMIYIGK